VQAAAPVADSTAAPATIARGAPSGDQTPKPAAAATTGPVAATDASAAPTASPTPGVIVLGARKAKRDWKSVATAGLRRSPRGAFAAVVHRWRTAGLPEPSIDPLAGRVAWKRAMAIVRNGAAAGGAGLADIHPPGQSAVAPVAGAQKKAGGKKVVPVTPGWQATLKTPQPTARPTPKARPTPHARPTHGGATPVHRPTPRPRPTTPLPTTPRPEHTWQNQPAPVTTPSLAPPVGDADGADGASLRSEPGAGEGDGNGGEKGGNANDRSVDGGP
jgi:hypothetical protein